MRTNAESLDKRSMTLGSRIEQLRVLRGLSQAELARRVGVRQSTMNSLINGDSRTSRSLLAIARELNTTPAYLTGDTDDPSPDAAMPALLGRDRELIELFHALGSNDQVIALRLLKGFVQTAGQ